MAAKYTVLAESENYQLVRVGDECAIRPKSYPDTSAGRWECSYQHYLSYQDVYTNNYGYIPVSQEG